MTEEDPDLLAGDNLDRLRGRPMTDSDIVARLRLYAKRMDETRSTVLGLLLADTADEIERLRNEKEQDEAKIWVADKEIERLESERNEAIVLANAVIRSASALITFKIPAAKASSYWNAVDEFRRFDERTT
jgi:predicted transcriptional regulator